MPPPAHDRALEEQRERPASFMYEPSVPPTIPPGLTVADWRRRRARPRPRRWLRPTRR